MEPDFINRGVYLAEEFAEGGYYAILTARCFWRVRRQLFVFGLREIVSGGVRHTSLLFVFSCSCFVLHFVKLFLLWGRAYFAKGCVSRGYPLVNGRK